MALPTNLEGVVRPPAPQLVGLSASHTGELRLNKVRISREWLLAGPTHSVMRGSGGAGTGGLQTSTLAIGLAGEAIDYLQAQSLERTELAPPAAELGATTASSWPI